MWEVVLKANGRGLLLIQLCIADGAEARKSAEIELIQGAGYAQRAAVEHMCVDHGGADAGVT